MLKLQVRYTEVLGLILVPSKWWIAAYTTTAVKEVLLVKRIVG